MKLRPSPLMSEMPFDNNTVALQIVEIRILKYNKAQLVTWCL